MDLKVHVDYEKARDYSRLNPGQKKIFYDYYENKISKEFDDKKLTGDELVQMEVSALYERLSCHGKIA